MTQQKMQRLAAAGSCAAVLLIVVMLAVVIYQIVQMVMLFSVQAELNEKIKEYERLIETSEDDLEYLRSEQFLRDLAFEKGYRFSD